MTRRNDISQELQEISPGLDRIDLVNPYRAPVGYFDSLAEMILLRIKAEDAGSASEELEMISPLLGSIRKEMPFSVPEGYFEKLSSNISRPQAKEPARVISLQPRKIFRYAVAAVTIGVICVFAWLFISKPVNDEQTYAAKETIIESQVIENIDKLSEREIADFLDARSPVYNADANGSAGEIKDADVQLMLADITDNELEGYLQANSPVKEKFN